EEHQPRRVAVDPVHDEGSWPAAALEILVEIVEHRTRATLALERHRQDAGGFVEDDNRVVFVDDRQIALVAERRRRLRRTRTIHPDVNDVAGSETRRGRAGGHLAIVEEDFAPLERGGGSRARA